LEGSVVHDWAEIVRTQLGSLGLDAAYEEEVRAELAAHLEDLYAEARRSGSSESQAMARALARVPDWSHLARTIRRADRRDAPMTRDARTIWLPGMAALIGAAAVILVSTLLPSSLWVDHRADLPMALAAISIYLGCGALGAGWSRRAGGSVGDRVCAGLFPLALHLAIFLLAIVVLTISEGRLNLQLKAAAVFLLTPGLALAVGTLPFLRDA
jgi:hypothetical protein